MSVLLGSELNSLLIDLFEKRISTVILATTDKNHHPHTAPFNCVIAQDVKTFKISNIKGASNVSKYKREILGCSGSIGRRGYSGLH